MLFLIGKYNKKRDLMQRYYELNSFDGQFKYNGSTQTTIEELIQNPSTHYAIKSTVGEYVYYVPIASTGDLTKDWWNPETKTIYDPCPYGYRIPKVNTYGNASDWAISTWGGNILTEGHSWKSSLFPVSGSRSYKVGKFGLIGAAGYYWMSTTYNKSNSPYLRLSSNSLTTPTAGLGRSDGFQTRCIEDKPIIPTSN